MIYRLEECSTAVAPSKGDIILVSDNNQLYAYKANDHSHCLGCCFNEVDGCSRPTSWVAKITCLYASFSILPIESVMEEII